MDILENDSCFSTDNSGVNLICPEFKTPVETVKIHLFDLIAPLSVITFTPVPLQSIFLTLVFN